MKRGRFISLEGIDFVGKTPFADWLQRDLTAQGYEVVLTRDPPYFLSPWDQFSEFFERGESITKLAEAVLLLAARLDNSERKILGALAQNAIVIADRYIDSWFVYQSIRLAPYFGGETQALEFLIQLNESLVSKRLLIEPDLTVWLSDDPYRTIKRAEHERKISKYENLPMQLKVETRYGTIHECFTQRIIKVDIRGKEIPEAYPLVKMAVFNALGSSSTGIAELPKNSGYSRMIYMYPEFFATKNENKLREVGEILGRSLEQISVELFEPQGVKVEDVVREKAENAFHKTGKFVLVEDTGLEFVAWNGLPGALIKWFLDTAGNEGILKMFSGETNRKAIAKTAVGFFDGAQARVFVGEISGTIPETVRGTGGFGWDPIFVPDGYKKSFAEMTSAEKNAISMRKLALERMKAELK